MGAGKTTVGRPLAAAIERPYLDSDEELAARCGSSAEAVQQAQGRSRLHEVERDILAGMAGRNVVFGAAASVADTEAGRALLSAATAIYLHAAPDTLVGRAMTGPHRPLPDQRDAVLRVLREQYRERDGRYREVARIVLDVEDATPKEVVAALIRTLADM